jgi:hypothetical protein
VTVKDIKEVILKPMKIVKMEDISIIVIADEFCLVADDVRIETKIARGTSLRAIFVGQSEEPDEIDIDSVACLNPQVRIGLSFLHFSELPIQSQSLDSD